MLSFKYIAIILLIIFVLVVSINLVANYEPLKYDVKTESKVIGYCYYKTCYGIISNNGTITDVIKNEI